MKNLITCLVVSVLSSVVAAEIHHVPADFPTIQYAVDAALDGDEIIVAPGTYTSTASEVVDMRGKEIWLHSSAGAEVTIIDGEGARRGILCNNQEPSNTIIEGFTITNGYAKNGGGMYNYISNPTLTNCTFTNNYAQYAGGGMFNTQNSSPTLENCTFSGNTAYLGGGVYCLHNSDLLMTNCTFTSNVAITRGGGIYNEDNGELILNNCTFSANTIIGGQAAAGTTSFGAGIFCWESKATLNDCVFEVNTAPNCAAIYLAGENLNLYSCTFNNNSAEDIGGVFCGGGGIVGEATAVIENCNFTGNSGVDWGGALLLGADYAITHCNFNNNTARRYGSAIEIYSSLGTGTINSCVFSNNSALYGAAILIHEGNAEDTIITDTIFCGNFPNHISGLWTDGGDNCQGGVCEDINDDGVPDECSDEIDLQIHVPEEYSTIQSAVIAAESGAEIIVAPGVYTSEIFSVIHTGGKKLWIHSSDGPEVTVIDGEESIRGILCVNNETSKTIIEGFTITRGYDDEFGGGMFCSYSSPTIINCIFKNNSANDYGGGMYNDINSSPSLTDTTVCGNTPDQIYGDWTDNGGNTIADVCPECPDINGDGYVNVSDLLTVIDQWGLTNSPADVNQDGIVNVSDLLMVISNWGPCE